MNARQHRSEVSIRDSCHTNTCIPNIGKFEKLIKNLNLNQQASDSHYKGPMMIVNDQDSSN